MESLEVLERQFKEIDDSQGIKSDALQEQIKKGKGNSAYAQQLRIQIASLKQQSRMILNKMDQYEKEQKKQVTV